MKEEETKKKKTTAKKTTTKKSAKKTESKEVKKVAKKETKKSAPKKDTKVEEVVEVEKVQKPKRVTKKKEAVDVLPEVKDEAVPDVVAEVEVKEDKEPEKEVVIEEKTAPVGIISEDISKSDLDDTIAAEPIALDKLGKSQFDGKLLQLIGWWLIGLLITTITFGLGAPFAKCFILDWKFKHTKINGKRLCFDGNGLQLWGNIIKWTFFTIITLGIFLLFLPVQWNRWIVKHTHYEGNRKPKINYSLFDGITWEYIGISVLSGLLKLFSFGLLTPFCDNLMYSWRINHTTYDTIDMEFDGKGFQLLGNYIKWTFFTIITLGIYGLWVPIKKIKWEVKHTNEKGFSKRPYKPVLGMILPILFALACVSGEIFGLTKVDKNKWVEIKDGINEYINNVINETKKYDFGHVFMERVADVYYIINTKDFKITWDERYVRYFDYNKVDKFSKNYYVLNRDNNFEMALVKVKTSKNPVLIVKHSNKYSIYWLYGNKVESHFYPVNSSAIYKVVDKNGNSKLAIKYNLGGSKLDYVEDVVNYSYDYAIYGCDEEAFAQELLEKGLKLENPEIVFKNVNLKTMDGLKELFASYNDEKVEPEINIDIPEPQIKLDGFKDYYLKYVEDNIKNDVNVGVLQYSSLDNPVLVIAGKKETTILSFVNNKLITDSIPSGELGAIKKSNKSINEPVIITTSGKNQLYYFIEAVVNKDFDGDKMIKVKKSKAAKSLKSLGYSEVANDFSVVKASRGNLSELEKALDVEGEVIDQEEEVISKLHVGDFTLEYGDYKNGKGATISILSNGSYSYVATEEKTTIREVGEYKVKSNSICTESTTKGSNVSTKCWIVNDNNKFTDIVDNDWTFVN